MSDAVQEYNALIEREPQLLDESRDFLEAKLKEVRLVFGGRLLTPYLRPHFVTRAEWQRITRACEAVWSAVEKVGRAAPADQLMFEQIGLTEGERELVAIDPGYRDVSVTSRLDSFLTENSYQFVELTAECPAGIAYADVAAEAFMDLPLMREFRKTHDVAPMYCRRLMLDALLKVYAEVRGQGERPQIGIVDYKGLPTQREFEMFKAYFEQHGYRATIADPRDVRLRKGRLYHEDFRIDLVYRRVLTTELLEKKDECRDFIDAYKQQAAVFVNSFRTKYVHKKMLFGVLTDERHQHRFTEAERQAIARHIPWTRRVEAGRTTHAGREIDLLEFIRTARHNLVLKPNDDYGGHGIFIGWESSAAAWDAAIDKALAGDYLARERAATPRARVAFTYQGARRAGMIP